MARRSARTREQFAVLRSLRALTDDHASAKRLLALVPADHYDQVITDARTWVATATITVPVRCRTHDQARTKHANAAHTITLDRDGLHTNDHPAAHDWPTEAFLTALGAPTPTCVLFAAAVITGRVDPEHDTTIQGTGRTPLLTLRHLHGLRAWLTHDPDANLAALAPVIRHGLTPADWQAWTDAGFTPATAGPFLTAHVPASTAATWLSAGLATHQGATLAQRGRTPAQVTALVPYTGLTDAYGWVRHHPNLDTEVHLELRTAGYTAKAAASAIKHVDLDGARAFAAHSLTDSSRTSGAWWGVLPDHPDDAARWAALGFTPGHASAILDARADLMDDIEEYGPDMTQDWVEAGVRSIDELATLAALTYHPCEWENRPRIICPDGLPLPWHHAIWLARHVEDPAAWVAAAATAPEWAHTWAGPRCLIPTCQTPGCTADVSPGHGALPDGTADLDYFYDAEHPYWDDDRAGLLDAICEAAAEGVPAEVLPTMARHARHGADLWHDAIENLAQFTTPEDLAAFLDSIYTDQVQPEPYRSAA